jgi:hypothetical protein
LATGIRGGREFRWEGQTGQRPGDKSLLQHLKIAKRLEARME